MVQKSDKPKLRQITHPIIRKKKKKLIVTNNDEDAIEKTQKIAVLKD